MDATGATLAGDSRLSGKCYPHPGTTYYLCRMSWGKDKGPRSRGTFEQEWPDLVRGLDRTLRGRNVPAARREDIIQETGLRLFVRWSELDPDRPLWPFAITIAINLLRDEQRMQARRNASPQPIPEMVERGVEEEALARLELTDVRLALQQLTPAQRSVLLADIGAAPYDDRGADALKMLRMRARRTLRNVMGRASALLPFGALRLRRAANSIAINFNRAGSTDQVQGLALSTLGVAGAAAILGATVGIVVTATDPPLEGNTMIEAGAASHVSDGAALLRTSLGHGSRRLSTSGTAGVVRHQGSAHSLGTREPGDHADGTQLKAGGTGIDEDPSLESDRYRISVFARIAAAGEGAVVDSEVEQANPSCGSPTDPRDRPCLRPSPPKQRSRADAAGYSTDDFGTQRYL